MKRRRGRPTGFKMSKDSKDAISNSKEGYKHKEGTRQIISDGVKKYHETGAPIDIIMNTDLSECGTYPIKSGYIRIAIPNPTEGEPSYHMFYHTALMEKELGRKLLPGEEIHHWGDKDNNLRMLITLCRDRKHHLLLDKAKKNVMNYIKKT